LVINIVIDQDHQQWGEDYSKTRVFLAELSGNIIQSRSGGSTEASCGLLHVQGITTNISSKRWFCR